VTTTVGTGSPDGPGRNRQLFKQAVPCDSAILFRVRIYVRFCKETQHQLIRRTVYTGTPVLVEYTLDEYAESLDKVIGALNDWGIGHRKKLMQADKGQVAVSEC
jgi:DNA-binding HxlR family transcriptional regulator